MKIYKISPKETEAFKKLGEEMNAFRKGFGNLLCSTNDASEAFKKLGEAIKEADKKGEV